MSIEALTYTEIEDEFAKISELEPGTDKHKVAMGSLTELMGKAIEMERLEIEREDKRIVRENDLLLRQQQLEDEKKSRLIQNIISAAGIILPVAVTIWGTKVSLKFEEEGTVTTQAGKSFIGRLFRK